MGRVIAITNLKGGIGKTTTVVNLGAGLALKGARVLLVDVDAQGNLAMALGVRPRRTLYEVLVDGAAAVDCLTPARPNLDLIAADESLLTAQPVIARRTDWPRVLEQGLRPIRNAYDFILIDCGGSLTVLNTNALVAASEVLVPTTVEPFSLKGLEMLQTQIVRVKRNQGALRAIVPTMYDPRLRQAKALIDELNTRYGDLVTTPIRVNVRLSESSAQGRTIYEFDPRSRGAVDYAMLVEQLSSRWDYRPAAHMPLPDQPVIVAPPDQPLLERTEPATPPVVTGAGQVFTATCPNCGHELRRATIAGYRIAFCDHCKYRRQELAGGPRR
jgi:chromosome partitioning protein